MGGGKSQGGGSSHQRAMQKGRLEKEAEALVPMVAAKMDARMQIPWYQSTLLWGCLSLAAAVVLTVVAAMKTDIRWILFFGGPFLCIAAWEFATYFTESRWKRGTATMVVAIVSAGGLYGLSVWLRPVHQLEPTTTEPTAFSAEVRSAVVSDSGPITRFVMTVGNTVSPIFYLAYIQITNLQDIPSVVDDVKIAVSKEPEGPWEDLVPMDLSISSHALFFLTASPAAPKFLRMYGTMRLSGTITSDALKLAAVVKAEPAMELELVKPIPPHTAIRGWVALHSPRHVGLTSGRIYFRVKILDAANRECTYVTELPKSSRQDTATYADSGQLDIVGTNVDLRGFQMKYFREP